MTDQTQPTTLLDDDTGVVAAQLGTASPQSDVERGEAGPATRPQNVPEKFWDASAATVRTDALLKSYLELEKRFGAGETVAPDGGADGDDAGNDDPVEEGATEVGSADDTAEEVIDEAAALSGVPETPDAYEIETTSELVAADPEINQRLHEAGFTQDQAQLVYRLAEEYLVPAVSDAYGEVLVQQEVGRLAQAFGGPEAWQATADQLRTWGKANLEAEIYDTLASNYDGVMAMHAMMQAREPAVVHADAPGAPGDEDALRRMMQDPRYWRDRDPAFIGEVTRGFERLFKD